MPVPVMPGTCRVLSALTGEMPAGVNQFNTPAGGATGLLCMHVRIGFHIAPRANREVSSCGLPAGESPFGASRASIDYTWPRMRHVGSKPLTSDLAVEEWSKAPGRLKEAFPLFEAEEVGLAGDTLKPASRSSC